MSSIESGNSEASRTVKVGRGAGGGGCSPSTPAPSTPPGRKRCVTHWFTSCRPRDVSVRRRFGGEEEL